MILEKWKNAQTYVIGKYHINNNMPCQDRTAYLQKMEEYELLLEIAKADALLDAGEGEVV